MCDDKKSATICSCLCTSRIFCAIKLYIIVRHNSIIYMQSVLIDEKCDVRREGVCKHEY